MHVLSSKSCWGGGGVASVEAPLFSWLEGAPLYTALLISLRFIDLALSSKTDKKKQ